MNDDIPGSLILALYVSNNVPDVFNGREVNASLPIFHHNSSKTITEKQEKFHHLLRRTISADKLIFSPDFSSSTYRREAIETFLKLSDCKFEQAFFFLLEPNLDLDEILSLNLTSLMSDGYLLLTMRLQNLSEAILEPASLFTESFFYFLKKQDLRTLHINCVVDDCIFTGMNESNPLFQRLQHTLKTHCSDLSVLTLRCSCREHGTEMVSHMAKLVHEFPHLQKIRFAASAEANAQLALELEHLLRLGVSMEFNIYRSHEQTACTGLRHHFDLVKAVTVKHAGKREVVDLVVFDNIEELELELRGGSETKLVAVPPENIQALRISASPMAAIGNGMVYYEPSENVLRMAMNHMPKLKDVSIVNCRITNGEMFKMMEHLGSNLERLEMSILDQEECPSKRLLDICITAIKFNSNIRTIKSKDTVEEDLVKVLKWGTETCEEYCFLHMKLREAFEKLIHAAPMLEPWHLTNAIESVLPNLEEINEVENDDFEFNSAVTTDED